MCLIWCLIILLALSGGLVYGNEATELHYKQLLYRDLTYLNVHAPLKMLNQSKAAAEIAASIISKRTLQWERDQDRQYHINHFLYQPVKYLVKNSKESILLATTASKLFMVRVALLVSYLPFYFLIAFVSVVEGLVQRDLRKFGGGRESTLLFHRAKLLIKPFFISVWLLYFILPITIPIHRFVIPSGIMFSLAVMLTMKSFKKYV